MGKKKEGGLGGEDDGGGEESAEWSQQQFRIVDLIAHRFTLQ